MAYVIIDEEKLETYMREMRNILTEDHRALKRLTVVERRLKIGSEEALAEVDNIKTLKTDMTKAKADIIEGTNDRATISQEQGNLESRLDTLEESILIESDTGGDTT